MEQAVAHPHRRDDEDEDDICRLRMRNPQSAFRSLESINEPHGRKFAAPGSTERRLALVVSTNVLFQGALIGFVSMRTSSLMLCTVAAPIPYTRVSQIYTVFSNPQRTRRRAYNDILFNCLGLEIAACNAFTLGVTPHLSRKLRCPKSHKTDSKWYWRLALVAAHCKPMEGLVWRMLFAECGFSGRQTAVCKLASVYFAVYEVHAPANTSAYVVPIFGICRWSCCDEPYVNMPFNICAVHTPIEVLLVLFSRHVLWGNGCNSMSQKQSQQHDTYRRMPATTGSMVAAAVAAAAHRPCLACLEPHRLSVAAVVASLVASAVAAAAATPAEARRERDDPFDIVVGLLMQRLAPAWPDQFVDGMFENAPDPSWAFEDDDKDDMLMSRQMAAQMHFCFLQRRRADVMNRGVAGAAATALVNAAAVAVVPAMGLALRLVLPMPWRFSIASKTCSSMTTVICATASISAFQRSSYASLAFNITSTTVLSLNGCSCPGRHGSATGSCGCSARGCWTWGPRGGSWSCWTWRRGHA